MAKKSKDNNKISKFGPKENIETPSNNTESAIMGGLETKLDIFMNDISSAMLSLITGDKTAIHKPGQIFSHINRDKNLFNKVNQINLKFDNLNNQISNFANKFDSIFNKYDNQSLILEQLLTNFDVFLDGFTTASYVRDDLISQITDLLNDKDNDKNNQTVSLIFDKETKKYIDNVIKEFKKIKVKFNGSDLNITEEYFKKLDEIFKNGGIADNAITDMDNTSNKLKKSLENIEELIKNINIDNIEKLIEKIDFNKLNDGISSLSALVNNINSIDTSKKPFNGIIKNVESLNTVFTELSNIKVNNKKLNSLNDSITKVNNIFSIVQNTQSISNVDAKKMADSITAIIDSLKFDTSGIDLTGLEKIFKDLDQILENIKNIDFSDKLDIIKENLKKVEDFYNNDVKNLADLIDNNKDNISKIQAGVKNSYDVAVSGTNIDKKAVKESRENINSVSESIALLGLVMIIGGLIISKHQELIISSLIFGVTLSAFLLTLMPPIYLMIKINSELKKSDASIKGINKFLITCSFLMLLGGYIVDEKILKDSLKFGIRFSLFLITLMIPLNMMSKIASRSKESMKNLQGINAILLGSALLMWIGSYIVDYIDKKKALEFGVLLAKFIFVTIAPFMIYGIFVKNALDSAAGVKKLLITSTILMILGSYFVDQENFVNKALNFGLVLGAFIFSVISPIILFSFVAPRLEKTIKQLRKFIVVNTLIMLLGAAMAKDEEFVNGALTFGILLFKFITLSILPVILFSMMAKKLIIVIPQIKGFILESILLLMIGSAIVNKHPEIINGALKFGLYFAGFITLLILPLLLLRRSITHAFASLAGISLLVFTSGLIMAATVMMVEKYGWKKVLIGVGIFVGFIAIITGVLFLISKLGTVSIEAAGVAILMSAAIAVLGLSLLVVQKVTEYIDFGTMIKFIGIMSMFIGVELILGLIAPLALPGVATATLLGLSLTILAGSFFIVHYLVNNDEIDFNKDFEKLKDAIIIAGDTFRELGENWGKIIAGSAAAVFMGVGLTIIGLSFLILHYTMIKATPEEDFNKLNNALIIAGECFSTLGKSIGWIIAGSVTAIFMSIGLLAITGTFMLIHLFVKNRNDYVKDIDFVFKAVQHLEPLFKSIIKQSLNALGATASAVIILAAIGSIDLTMALIKRSAKLSKDVDIKDFENIAIVLKTFLNVIPKDVISNDIKRRARRLKNIAKSISGALNYIISSLTNYKDISDLNIKQVSQNIEILIATLITSINSAFKKVGGEKEIKRIKKEVKKLYPIGTLITKLAKGLQAYANLNFPVYDDKGNIIRYERFNDFKGAADNINTVISTMVNAVQDAYDKLGEGKINKIRRKIKSLYPIGNLITKIAHGLQSYAELKFPIYKGIEIVGYKELDRDDFKEAGKNIGVVITTMIDAIASAYDKMGDEKPLRVFGKIYSLIPVGNLLSSMAQGIQSYADLKFPIYKGTEVTGYKELLREDFENAASNIGVIITTVVDAVERAYDRIGGNKPSKVFGKIASLMPIGNLIMNIAAGIQAYANLKFPEYEGTKTVRYKELKPEDLTKASKNIGDIIRNLTDSVSTALDKIQDKPNKIKRKIKAISKIGKLISSIASGLQAYAELKFPTYDKDGNVIEYRPLSPTDFTNAATNISTVIETISKGISNGFNEIARYEKKEKIESNRKTKKRAEIFIEYGKLIESIATGIQAYANLKFPVYNPDGSVKEYKELKREEFEKAAENISVVITTLSAAIKKGFSKMNSLFGAGPKKKIQAMVEVGTLISDVANGIQAYANLNFPIYDKDGAIIGYKGFDDNDFIKASDNISDVITFTTQALKDSFDKLNIEPDDLQTILNSFKPVSDIIKNTADAIVAYASGNFTDANGKVVKIDEKLIKDASKNIELLLNTVVGSISKIFKEHNVDGIIIPEGFISNINDIFMAVGDVNEIIVKYSEIDNAKIVTSLDNINTILDKFNDISVKKLDKIKDNDFEKKLNTIKTINP